MNHKAAIPNAFTLTNLLLGILSIVYTMDQNYMMSAIMILLAAVLDGMDGRVARKLEVSSAFGKELDSLSDLVSFGVAPAILVYAAHLEEPYHYVGLAIAIVFALCGAVRLARFNVLNITTHFLGIPITVAGPLMALFSLAGARLPVLFFPIAMLLLAGLMVSNLKVPKL
ncbi:CDP-diacylglycerol--serine O-phosphatidyltransferase [Heliobacterium gestii]|uniref:CDP-diacylglycerol--serine O-phosphatidyltransferase n=1 Tax=Heliomicrobium gestii TaxID=2699 RepID=A0A845LEN1_HELGE|nr:CDP-diacylglycerol--serine O-phosphatidyltransferase [Heliomicrobium gestii]MBM7867291.1 CDP-diacylglycerol--serine O-phosphatidyltransferase [Heliomicrobium gestii]MZP43844.1 CDP-diacylglycerol--serine O-phosphatidyltransferase [Heliomicrobium gestii]